MSKFWRYFSRGAAITGIIIGSIPKIMADKAISVQEVSQLTVDICAVAGWKVKFEIPDEIKDVIIGAAFEED